MSALVTARRFFVITLILSLALSAAAQLPTEERRRHRVELELGPDGGDGFGPPPSPPPNFFGPLPTPFLDWYDAEYIRVVDFDGSISPDILMPFYTGASTDIPPEVQQDFLPEAGWELLYNHISTDVYFPVPFFAIYNKYRGIARYFYFYNNSVTFQHLSFGILARGSAETSLLNSRGDFDLADASRAREPFLVTMNTETLGVSGPARHHWHYFEAPFSYDSAIDSVSTNHIRFDWFARGTDISEVEITGVQQGSLKGTIELSGSSNFLALGGLSFNKSSTSNTSATFGTVKAKSGSSSKDGFFADLGAKIAKQTKTSVATQIGKLGGQLVSSAAELLGSPFSSIIKKFLGGNSATNPGSVSLQMDTKIELDGTITLQNQIFNQTLKVPGTTYTITDNVVIPAYDEPLGVMNLAATPKLRYSEVFSDPLGFAGLGTRTQYYHLTGDALDLVINPAIEGDIEITDVSPRLLYYTNYSGPTDLGRFRYAQTLRHDGHTHIDSDPDFDLWFAGHNGMTLEFMYRQEPWVAWQDQVHHGIVVEVTVAYEVLSSGEELFWRRTFRPEFVQ